MSDDAAIPAEPDSVEYTGNHVTENRSPQYMTNGLTVVKRRYRFNLVHPIPCNEETLYTMLTVVTEKSRRRRKHHRSVRRRDA